LTNLRFNLNFLGEDFRGDYAKNQVRSSDMALIRNMVGAEAIDDSEYKLSNIQIALRDNRTALEESFEQMSVLLRYPLKECTSAERKDIVFDNRELRIVNWEQTKLSLSDRVTKDIESASEETDKHFEYLKTRNPS
jgi:maltodextrin utilization protein YvdJ